MSIELLTSEQAIAGTQIGPKWHFRETALESFDMLTLADVAALLRCSKAHVCNAVAGRVPGCVAIPAVSLGRRKLVRREALLHWIEENEKAGTIASKPERGRKDA